MRNENILHDRSTARRLRMAALIVSMLPPSTAAFAADLCDTPRSIPSRSELLSLGLDFDVPLHLRVAPPSAEALAAFSQMAGKKALAHELNPADKQRLEQAFSSLPVLHREFLKHHLRHLSFIDADGVGSGLTASVGDEDYPLFDITLRAGILNESLSEFLTTKERQVFSDDGSGASVSVIAPGDALFYVLLHEASHVVDDVLNISSELTPEFNAGVWLDRRRLSEPWKDQALAATSFRGGGPIPVAQAVELYDLLSDTPFVSLYATAAAPEDFAELLSWQELSMQYPEDPLKIVVRDGYGTVLYALEPAEGASVLDRMKAIEELLANC